jgi:hypothetical protein
MTLTSTRVHTKSYSPELLNSMEQAFKEVWATLYAHMPAKGEDVHELQVRLSRTIVGLASDGITDPANCDARLYDDGALPSLRDISSSHVSVRTVCDN